MPHNGRRDFGLYDEIARSNAREAGRKLFQMAYTPARLSPARSRLTGGRPSWRRPGTPAAICVR